MRAVVHDRYGPPEVLRLEEVERPVPADDELLVRIHATTVTRRTATCARAKPVPLALHARAADAQATDPRHASSPAVVAAVGSAVTEFAVGDRVFGLRNGAHAEYVCVRESRPASRTCRRA